MCLSLRVCKRNIKRNADEKERDKEKYKREQQRQLKDTHLRRSHCETQIEKDIER